MDAYLYLPITACFLQTLQITNKFRENTHYCTVIFRYSNCLRFYLSEPLFCPILARLIGTLDASKRTLGSLKEKCLSGGQIFWSWLDSLSVAPQLFITTSFGFQERNLDFKKKKRKRNKQYLSFAWNSIYPRTYLG